MRRCRSELMQNMEFVRHICAKRCPCAQRMTQFWRNNNNNNNQPFTSQLFFSFFYFVSFSYLCFIIHFIHALVRLSRWIHQMHKCTCRNMARMAHTIAITANYTELNTNTHTHGAVEQTKSNQMAKDVANRAATNWNEFGIDLDVQNRDKCRAKSHTSNAQNAQCTSMNMNINTNFNGKTMRTLRVPQIVCPFAPNNKIY